MVQDGSAVTKWMAIETQATLPLWLDEGFTQKWMFKSIIVTSSAFLGLCTLRS